MNPLIGAAYSPEVLKYTTPFIPEYLRSWIPQQRKDAIEGGMIWDKEEKKMVHDGKGLEAAQKDLRSVENSLKMAKSADMIQILKTQKEIAESRIQYYEGIIYILDQNS